MKQNTRRLILLLFALTACPSRADSTFVVRDFSKQFQGLTGTMVVYSRATDTYTVHNRQRSTTRFTPLSTFKIPNSLIALEEGVVAGVDSQFTWDTARYPAQDWWPEQWHSARTMREAIRYSVVPFYREIARRVGAERMGAYVRKFGYGNADISSGVDNFWLTGSLAISAMEQVGFLRRFYAGRLGVNPRTTAAVKDILVLEQNDRWRLSAKTGAGTGFDPDNPARALGWYVGYVEKDEDVIFFALNVETDTFAEIVDCRKAIAMAVLGKLRI